MIKRFVPGLLAFLLVLMVILLVAESLKNQHILSQLELYEEPAPYKVERDDYGIPSIYGATDPAVAYGLARAHAEDDFYTIQLQLAAVKGQLGAITGKDGAVIDAIGHILGVQSTTANGMERLSEEARALAEGYAAGINRHAYENSIDILRYDLFPVTAEDVVGGFVLSSPFFYGLDGTLRDLFEGKIPAEDDGPEHRGSNAIVIAPSRMADRSTMLISNSHQPWTGVVAWYEARLASAEGWSMAGALFPGVPFILMGYNEHLSWTNTVNVPDLIDVYELETDPSGQRYRYDDEWLSFEERKYKLKVKIGPFMIPQTRKALFSVHGPVISNDKGMFAIRYAGIGETRQFEQYYRLNQSKSFDQWKEVMAIQAIPSTNFLYADKEGNIGYLYNASFPKRSTEVDWSGILPGDRSDLVWQTYEPSSKIPFLINPDSGYIVDANNTPFLATTPEDDLKPEDFKDLVGIEDRMTNRILRLIKLMEEDSSLTREDLDRIKFDDGYDATSPLGSLFVDFMAGIPDGVEPEAAQLLRRWDYTLDGHGDADAIAAYVMFELYKGMRGYEPIPSSEEAITQAADHLRTHFERLDPPYTEMSRLRRGDQDLPLVGGPDALRAVYWDVNERDGIFEGGYGDSYIAYVRWDQDGQLHAETIYPFGAAMTEEESPHYADQAALFAAGKMKQAPLPDWRDALELLQ